MDPEELRKASLRMARAVEGYRERPVVAGIWPQLKKEPRIKLLRGLRGVGKTTIMLQLFRREGKRAFYLSADSPMIKEGTLYGLLKELLLAGHETLFIDEIHTYPGWRKEIKAVYDEFRDASLVCSGSAPLALVPERREKEYEISPLSLSEYIYLKSGEELSAGEEWKSAEDSLGFVSAHEKRIEPAYREYSRAGGFPVALSHEIPEAMDAIYNTIRKSIRDDSVSVLKLSAEKVFAMEKFMVLLATSLPGELSITSLSSNLGVSKTTAYEILDAMREMKLMRVLRPYGRGPKSVRSEPKVLFSHPNLRESVCRKLGEKADKGALREEAAAFALEERGWRINTIRGMKSSPDYVISRGREELVVEVGGKSKGGRQLREFRGRFPSIILGDDQIKCLLLRGRPGVP